MIDDAPTLARTNLLLITLIEEVRALRRDFGERKQSSKRSRWERRRFGWAGRRCTDWRPAANPALPMC